MTNRASGTFEVTMEPLPSEPTEGRPVFPRLRGEKRFHGDLDGTSQSEMMSVESPVKGSGAYVAIEQVSGSLQGRKGTFILIHNGTMRQGGDFRMDVKVVPDSGTELLAGLTGTMEIVIEGGNHSYNFDYELPA